MVKPMNESTRLLYGTGSLQDERERRPRSVPLTTPKSRAWYCVAAALLCTGALVSKEWHAPPLTATVLRDAQTMAKENGSVPVVTLAPTETPLPSESTPAVAVVSTEVPVPSETAPVDAAVQSVTPTQSVATETSAPVPSVMSSTAPVVTSVTSKTPAASETVKPVVSETVKPVVSETPSPSETVEPVVSETPVASETVKPVASETHAPSVTVKPVVSETPAPSTAEPTTAPVASAPTVTIQSAENNQFKAFYESLNSFINASADPCTDFYEYACGNWLATHEIPSDGASIDASFYAVTQDNKKIIQSIIDAKPPVIGEFYDACVNKTEDVDTESVAFVSDIISKIHETKTTFELITYAGQLNQELGISSFFGVDVQADPANPDMDVLTLVQGGLTLPSREYYLEKAKLDKYSKLFVKYVEDLFSVGDLDKHNVSKFASNILQTEAAFAKISLSNAELRDPWTTNTPFSISQIHSKYPYLYAYLSGIDKKDPIADVPLIVQTPRFFDDQNAVLSSIKLDQLKNYLSFHVIDSFGDVLGETFRRASHDFHGAVRGAGSLAPREKFCVDTTTTYVGTQLGEYYMLKVFGKEAKASAQALVDQIEDSMNRLLSKEDWLDEATVAAAREKLQHVRNYIGGPDKVTELPFKIKSDKFFENVLSLKKFAASDKVRQIGKPVNRESWDMFASTVNAYYDPSANKMVFPAAILQPPFYSAKSYPAVANYARIGMVMGHELSHGFDDQGRNFDAKGTLRKWWSPQVSAEFEKRAQCLASQYSSFPVVAEGQLLGNLNGKLTLGENIADNGGIHLSYQAYQIHKNVSHIAAATTQEEDDRVFFISFAQQWCEKRSAAYSEVLRQTDPHSPGRWRVNGPAMNFDKFAQTFKCAAGTPMNPTNRCVIW